MLAHLFSISLDYLFLLFHQKYFAPEEKELDCLFALCTPSQEIFSILFRLSQAQEKC